MTESDRRHHRVRAERTRATVTLTAEDGTARERVIELIRAQDEVRGDRLRLRVLEPADIKGTALLSLEHPGLDGEQWLFLPAVRRTRRLGPGELGDRFAGTDFSFADFKRRRVADYRYRLLRSGASLGHDCWVIEAVPAAPKVVKESPYGRIVTCLRKDNLYPVHLLIFDRQGRRLKEVHFEELRAVAGKAWRHNLTTVVDVQRQLRTRVRVFRREVDVALPPGAFDPAALAGPPARRRRPRRRSRRLRPSPLVPRDVRGAGRWRGPRPVRPAG